MALLYHKNDEVPLPCTDNGAPRYRYEPITRPSCILLLINALRGLPNSPSIVILCWLRLLWTWQQPLHFLQLMKINCFQLRLFPLKNETEARTVISKYLPYVSQFLSFSFYTLFQTCVINLLRLPQRNIEKLVLFIMINRIENDVMSKNCRFCQNCSLTKIFVRSGIWTHALRRGLRPERSALDHSAILTCYNYLDLEMFH